MFGEFEHIFQPQTGSVLVFFSCTSYQVYCITTFFRGSSCEHFRPQLNHPQNWGQQPKLPSYSECGLGVKYCLGGDFRWSSIPLKVWLNQLSCPRKPYNPKNPVETPDPPNVTGPRFQCLYQQVCFFLDTPEPPDIPKFRVYRGTRRCHLADKVLCWPMVNCQSLSPSRTMRSSLNGDRQPPLPPRNKA